MSDLIQSKYADFYKMLTAFNEGLSAVFQQLLDIETIKTAIELPEDVLKVLEQDGVTEDQVRSALADQLVARLKPVYVEYNRQYLLWLRDDLYAVPGAEILDADRDQQLHEEAKFRHMVYECVDQIRALMNQMAKDDKIWDTASTIVPLYNQFAMSLNQRLNMAIPLIEAERCLS